jgi:hypothetical protein
MKKEVTVSIKVRNPDWYWTKEEIAESKEGNSIDRESWEMINEDKIPKHSKSYSFGFDFDVESYKVNRNETFDLIAFTSEHQNFSDYEKHVISLKDVTIIKFEGSGKTSHVVVANDLIHQFINAQKGADGVIYWYFYLKENSGHNELSMSVWVSDNHLEKINKELEDYNYRMLVNV